MTDQHTPLRTHVLTSAAERGTLETADTIQVSRAELEHEHLHLLARVQQLRRLLGYPPLPTGKQQRRERSR